MIESSRMEDDFEISLRRAHEPADDVVLRRTDAPPAVLHRGRRISLNGAGLTVGRDPRCDLVLASGLVAPEHALIVGSNGDYVLEDLHSRTGTYLNGER